MRAPTPCVGKDQRLDRGERSLSIRCVSCAAGELRRDGTGGRSDGRRPGALTDTHAKQRTTSRPLGSRTHGRAPWFARPSRGLAPATLSHPAVPRPSPTVVDRRPRKGWHAPIRVPKKAGPRAPCATGWPATRAARTGTGRQLPRSCGRSHACMVAWCRSWAPLAQRGRSSRSGRHNGRSARASTMSRSLRTYSN